MVVATAIAVSAREDGRASGSAKLFLWQLSLVRWVRERIVVCNRSIALVKKVANGRKMRETIAALHTEKEPRRRRTSRIIREEEEDGEGRDGMDEVVVLS